MRRNRSQRRLRIGVTAAAIVASVVVATILLFASVPQQSHGKTQLYPWAFPGATAEYFGTTTVGGVPYSMTYTLHVLAVNSTKAEVLTMNNLTIGKYPPGITQKVLWYPALKTDGPAFLLASADVGLTHYETNVTIRGHTIPVIAYTLDDPQRVGHKEEHRLITNLLDAEW